MTFIIVVALVCWMIIGLAWLDGREYDDDDD